MCWMLRVLHVGLAAAPCLYDTVQVWVSPCFFLINKIKFTDCISDPDQTRLLDYFTYKYLRGAQAALSVRKVEIEPSDLGVLNVSRPRFIPGVTDLFWTLHCVISASGSESTCTFQCVGDTVGENNCNIVPEEAGN